MHHDPSDLGSPTRIWITPKERTLSLETQEHLYHGWLLGKSLTVLGSSCGDMVTYKLSDLLSLIVLELPYCLVVFFVVCPRLRPFWSVFGELACSWCSSAKIKTRQHRDFRSNQECPSLEANNSAGKITPGLNSSTHSRQRCCSSMSIHSIHNTFPQITSDAFISCSIGFRISN